MKMKDTLLMPKTKFEMRGNLPQKEPSIRKRWEKENLYEQMLEKRKDCPYYVLHDGPPYANANIHIGTAMNKIIKDFVVRSKSMLGYRTPFIPGWDTHGLPIENEVIKSGYDRKGASITEFRRKCNNFALKQIKIQDKQFKSLGSIGDYKKPYLTLHHEYEASQIDVFSTLALKGLIYRGLKPVYWGPTLECALAENEIEYKDKEDFSIYVKFKVEDGKNILDNDTYFVIWTTTPWTIPANLAIALHPQMEYGVFETSKGKLIFLKGLETRMEEEMGIKVYKKIKEFKGEELEYIKAKHPLYPRESIIILGDHVTIESGTGCVHTAPGHGSEDFIVGKKYNLDVLCPVDEKGFMDKKAGKDLQGIFYEKANDKVIEMLKKEGALLKSKLITHSYPHDWKHKKPVIFRATKQWFASIGKLEKEILKALEDVKFKNKWGKVRIENMITSRSDWCISRQRYWGVPIPIIYNEDGSPIIEEEVFDHIETLFKERGSNCWFYLSEKELLPPNYSNDKSPNNKFRKETDTMDVWFDSGISHTGVLLNRGLPYPADLYLEGSDQYRGWFNSSLILGVLKHGKSPYKKLVSHGFVLDKEGNKMSKSVGNVIDPLTIVSEYGSDILRLWVASVDILADVKIGDETLKNVSEYYRKIRNTLRFMLGNLTNKEKEIFDYENKKEKDLELVDTLILEKLKKLGKTIREAYDDFDYLIVFKNIINFISVDLSSFYLDITKDILYCESENSKRRKQVLTVLYKVLDDLILYLNPLIPHTMDEIYSVFKNEVSSPQLALFPKEEKFSEEKLKDYKNLIKLRDEVLKAIEEKRNKGEIKTAQEVKLYLNIKDQNVKKLFNMLPKIEQKRFFIVSSIELKDNLETENKYKLCDVLVEHFTGEKCIRCWNRFEESEIEDELCHRCQKVLNEYENQ